MATNNYQNTLSQDMLLTVTIEEQSKDAFRTVDVITVPIPMCKLSQHAHPYKGEYGIANITLGYEVSTTTDNYKWPCLESGKFYTLTELFIPLNGYMFFQGVKCSPRATCPPDTMLPTNLSTRHLNLTPTTCLTVQQP